jgi:predicted MFS family arabinose efflux permease
MDERISSTAATDTGSEWWRPLPRHLSRDARRLLAGRSIRAFADGAMAVVLPTYLLQRGFSPLQIGALVTATLLGSALATLAIGLVAQHVPRRRLLLFACLLMATTGTSFASTDAFWALLLIAFAGTLNPSAGDVSLFLPIEQTMLAETATPARRTALFARYSLAGALLGAAGTLAAPLPDVLARQLGWTLLDGFRAMFAFYGAAALAALIIYSRLSPAVEAPLGAGPRPALGESKRVVYGLAALFSLDAFGGGFFVPSLFTLWLYQTYHLSTAAAAAILFWAGLASAFSFLVAVPLSERFGLINTMVFTHLPANIMLILMPFAPNLTVAIMLLLARSALSQMDVPTRTAYVMAVVTPAERPAAASVTAVPRSLASAVSPIIAGYLLTLSPFGWPLIIGGGLKSVYDLLLLWQFRTHAPRH